MILVLKQKNIIFDRHYERGLGSLVTDRKLRIFFFYVSQLTELTLCCFYFFWLYKQNVHSVVVDFIPLIMNTIILQPSLTAR